MPGRVVGEIQGRSQASGSGFALHTNDSFLGLPHVAAVLEVPVLAFGALDEELFNTCFAVAFIGVTWVDVVLANAFVNCAPSAAVACHDYFDVQVHAGAVLRVESAAFAEENYCFGTLHGNDSLSLSAASASRSHQLNCSNFFGLMSCSGTTTWMALAWL
jgi:hypothetical protein